MGRPLKRWPRTALAVPYKKETLHRAHTRTYFFFFFQNFFLFFFTHETHSLFPSNFFNLHTSPSFHSLILHHLIIKHLYFALHSLSKVSFLHFSLVSSIRNFENYCILLVDSVYFGLFDDGECLHVNGCEENCLIE